MNARVNTRVNVSVNVRVNVSVNVRVMHAYKNFSGLEQSSVAE